MKSYNDISNRDKAKLSHKPTKDTAKSVTTKKEGVDDNDYGAIVQKGLTKSPESRETLLEFVTICKKRDDKIKVLEAAAKKSTLDT